VGAAQFRLREQRRLRAQQPAREVAFVVVRGAMLGGRAGGAERDDARRPDRGLRVPAREQVQRAAAEDRVHRVRQAAHAGQVAAQPVPAGRIRMRLPGNREDPPAGVVQALQQGCAKLAAGTEDQGCLHAAALTPAR